MQKALNKKGIHFLLLFFNILERGVMKTTNSAIFFRSILNRFVFNDGKAPNSQAPCDFYYRRNIKLYLKLTAKMHNLPPAAQLLNKDI